MMGRTCRIGTCGIVSWIVSGVLAWASATTTTGTLSLERDGNGNQFYKVTSSTGSSSFYATDIAASAKGQSQLPAWAKAKETVTVEIQNGAVTEIVKLNPPG